MDLSQISHVPAPAALGDTNTSVTAPMATIGAAPAPTYQQCDECAAPVDTDQRYCVSCGAHRRNVNDPAARYLSHVTARSRTSRAAAGRRQRRGSTGLRGLGIALVLALIPAVAAVGILVGRSSNNQDAKLIQAVMRNEAARATSSTAPTATVTSAASTPGTGRTAAHRAASRKRSSGKSTSAKSRQAASSTTKFGSVSQIAGAKPTKAQEQQGAQDAQNVQKSTGKNYVNGQNNLPGTVVVP
jgi:hypothetical protein